MTCSIAGCERKVHTRGWCQSHYRRWRVYGDATVPVRGEDRDTTERECRSCHKVLPIEDFYERSPGLRRRECKPCHIKAATSRVASQSPGDAAWLRRRGYTLRKKYGIGNAEFDALVIAQGGLCAICGEKPRVPRRKVDRQFIAFHVDHCHATGRVRGLLCAHCNTALGWVEAEPDRLQRVAEYLQA